MSKDEVVVPGSFLATEEEFVPGQNTYEAGEGTIRSDSLGLKIVDQKNHEVRVQKLKPVKALEKDSIVVGRVTLVKEKVALLSLLKAEKDGEERKILNTFAAIPVFNATGSFVKTMKDLYRIGDIVKAKVAMVSPAATDLSTNGPEFGVTKAFCIRCRQPLHLFDRTLKCGDCGLSQQRKVSKDYLLK